MDTDDAEVVITCSYGEEAESLPVEVPRRHWYPEAAQGHLHHYGAGLKVGFSGTLCVRMGLRRFGTSMGRPQWALIWRGGGERTSRAIFDRPSLRFTLIDRTWKIHLHISENCTAAFLDNLNLFRY